MAGTGGTTLWCIEVTEEQKLTVEALFQHYGWDLVEHPAEPVENRQPQKEPEHVAEDNEGIEVLDQDQEDVTTEGQMPTTSRRQPRRRQSESQPTTSTRSSNTECPSCFCDPCVTSRPQRWLGSGNPPGDGNSAAEVLEPTWDLVSANGEPDFLFKHLCLKGERCSN
ncbi:Hypp1176 [Branchiostoma lanceolatum]|uniref:Hypp1176 protein n=1 Tax=Branchiostoma lanceolatum TaxID=7740 RepID=A0A8J9ZF21_BRALA|nr:Hypp1176 [Branchiostoma lanceolatum]